MRDAYLSLRRQYEPERTKLAIVAESPPASGLYFYDPAGAPTEPLFAAVMRQLRLSPGSKEVGLRELQRLGWVLVDATYQPVNKFSASGRAEVIARDYPLLRDDLAALKPECVVLIKANVCRLLERKLVDDRFNVLNSGRVVYFPANGNQGHFQRQFGEIVPMEGRHSPIY